MLKSDIYLNCPTLKDEKLSLEDIKIVTELHDIAILSLLEKVEKTKGILSTTYLHNFEKRKEISELKKLREDMLCLQGIEIPEAYQREAELRLYSSFPLDVLVGSVSEIQTDLQTEEEIEKEYEEYYKKNLQTVLTGKIDVLAHVGLIHNAYGYPYYNQELLDTLLKEMIKTGTVLEMEPALDRKDAQTTFPSYSLLKRYHELGGENVVISSGAKTVEAIGNSLEEMYIMAKDFHLQPGYFEKRQFKKIL